MEVVVLERKCQTVVGITFLIIGIFKTATPTRPRVIPGCGPVNVLAWALIWKLPSKVAIEVGSISTPALAQTSEDDGGGGPAVTAVAPDRSA